VKTILAPIDFSAVSQRVVEVAAELAKATEGRVVLLHLVRESQVVTDTYVDATTFEELIATMNVAADRRLEEFKTALQRKSVPVRVVRLTGYPLEDIAEEARTLSADYIVIGSHGHTALHDLLLGSTSSAVIKRARCPVVVVPSLKRCPPG
jgi:nucleotide-binding universal stress UspA family protein